VRPPASPASSVGNRFLDHDREAIVASATIAALTVPSSASAATAASAARILHIA
jgi:hypothetical protein